MTGLTGRAVNGFKFSEITFFYRFSVNFPKNRAQPRRTARRPRRLRQILEAPLGGGLFRLAVDIVLHLLDGELLFGDDTFDQIADRYHADQFVAVHDRQVAEFLCGHQGHAFVD